jgi:hypothetical protein
MFNVPNGIPLASDRDQDINLIKDSENYSRSSFGKLTKLENKSNTLSILNYNIRSLPCNKDDLTDLTEELKDKHRFEFDVITLQETWLDSNLEHFVQLDGYNLLCKHKPKTKEFGGLGIFIKDSINYKDRPDIQFKTHPDYYFDCLFIEIIDNQNGKSTIIGTVGHN